MENFAPEIFTNIHMKNTLMKGALALLCTIMIQGAFADNSETAEFGTVKGRVVDESSHILPGASVYIENLKSGAISDMNGFYTLSNLKPGEYIIKVTYVGYESAEFKVTIEEGKTVEHDIILDGGVSLGEIVVGGAFRGQRKAINTQKNSIGIVNAVSADQVGKFPDSNIGDALKRINGINVQYDQGEARFGQVRGTSADMSSVTIDGNRIPSAEGETRNVQLDLIPSDMIQMIEVNKVITSDMDGDAIGGSINLITKNTPYERVLNATLGGGYNMISDKMQGNFGITYGDRFFKDRLGVMAAVSYQIAPGGSDNTEYEYDFDDNDKVVLTDAEIRQYYVTRERQSYSLALDWDITPLHRIYFNGIYNRRNDWENRYRITYKDIDKGENEMSARIQTKGGKYDTRNARLELQQTSDFSLGGEHLFGSVDVDWKASYASASEDRPNERYFELEQENLTFDFVDIGGRQPYTENIVSLNEGSWDIKDLTNGDEEIREKEMKFRLNIEIPLVRGNFGNKIKFGAKYVSKTKTLDKFWFQYKKEYEDLYGYEYMDNLAVQIRNGFYQGPQYRPNSFVSNSYLGNLDFTKMTGKPVYEESSGNYRAKETVTSGYVRFDQKLGEKVKLVAGLRMEATGIKYSGVDWIVDENEDESLRETPEKRNSYINLLPSFLMKYDITDNMKLRGSYTRTLSRPKYSELVPNHSINKADEEMYIGNPDLSPTFSDNFDLSAEYYFKSIGLVSAGLFYKNITDFIVEQNTPGIYEGFEYDKIKQPKNAGDATLLGTEIALQKDFGFITPALKCIGFYGTYTYTYSNVRNFNFEGRENEKGLRLPGSPEHTANASLYFEKAGFNLRISYNFASEFIDEVGEKAALDRYYDSVSYLDANASYSFGKNTKYTVYAEANNLLNQPLRYYQGIKERTMQSEYYGPRFNIGLKVNIF